MKRLLHILIILILSLKLHAQSSGKNDVITKINGDELTGKVIEINENEIKFSYPGETLIYTFKKADIRKISYASGRTETFNQSASSEAKADPAATGKSATAGSDAGDHSNRVAILPFSYIADGQSAPDALSEKAQS